MRTVLRITLHTVAAFLAATVACGQWNFTVDPSFQTQVEYQSTGSILLNEDGTLIASGIMHFPGEFSDKRLVRLLPDGTRDETFYNSGLGGGRLTTWQDRFYVGTQTVRRILPTGYQDPTFIGLNLGPYFSSLQGGDYHVYPDGRILLSGAHILSDSIRGFEGLYNLIWFSNTGYLDTTRTHRKGANNCAVYRFKELPNGQFICTSTCTQFEGKEVDWIFKVNADGTPDTTFRTGVFVGEALDFLPLSDGRVYVGGNFQRTAAPQDTLRLVRFLPDGSLDPSFTIPQFTAGEGLSTPFGANVHAIMAWRNGSIIALGHFKRVNGQVRKGICMIDSTGQLLNTFANAGVGPYTNQGLTAAAVLQMAFNADTTQAYICGEYNGYNDGTTNATGQRFVTRLNVVDLSTGVDEPVAQMAPMLSIQPNPASTWVAFNYQVPDNTGLLQLRVRDAGGRVVHSLQAAGTVGQQVWDTRNAAPGVYSVELLREGRSIHTERLVIQP